MRTQNGYQRSRTLALVLGIASGLAIATLMMLLTGAVADSPATADGSAIASGVVVDADGPVAGAAVRVRATDNVTYTTASGQFTLASLVEGQEIEVAAWADGYYIASTHVTPTLSGITLTLRPYHKQDHPDYEWTSPISGTSAGACGNCHPMIVSQWITNGHGLAVSNPRFFSLYNGTDLSGTISVGPGYLNDFPGTAGSCANCHAPGLGVDGYLTTNMNDARDVITAGIHCDYCHKVGGVYLNPVTRSVYRNVPGAQSTRLLRPPPGDNIFFGPYDDIHDPDTYLPAMTESQFCAPCHQFSFWGTPIYESYEEWLASPYAETGITCEKCHMPPNGDVYFALPRVGGLEHPPDRIPSHLDLGATSVELLQNTVSMTVAVEQTGSELRVTVTLTNTGAGHHVPTDHPGRHLILTVAATDGQGQALSLHQGSTVPDWGGAQAGLPGRAFAKLLRDVQSGEWPVVSYWKQALIVADNRIPAMESDTSVYLFEASPGGGPVTVTAELRFRRTFQAVMDAKGWDSPDIVMAMGEVTLP
jgi:Cytochrome c554 and c-prime